MSHSPIKVLYEDGDFIVFDKPSGLLVIPSPNNNQQTLVHLVNEQRSDIGRALYPCHRLDRETSGVIIFAKGKKNQKLMMQEFQNQAVQKVYLGFVRGRLQQKQGEIRRPVWDYHDRRFNKARPRLAVTAYQVKTLGQGYSVVEVFPKTGRTNQIRIHFRDIGHPLLGERIYAFRKDFSVDFRRLALHAKELVFRHPVLRKTIRVVSPVPEDMKTFLEQHQQ
jgi:23S rRNA pseudouridine1911/1915/1917 synthase